MGFKFLNVSVLGLTLVSGTISCTSMTGTLARTPNTNGPNVVKGTVISLQATYSGATSARIEFPLGTAEPGQVVSNGTIRLNTNISISGSDSGTPATYYLVGTRNGVTKQLAQFTYTVWGNSSPSPSPAPAPAPSPSPSASITIDQVIADIQNNPASEVIPLNLTYGWAYHAAIQNSNPGRGNNATLSWFVGLEGTGNTAKNTRIEVRNLRHYILSQTTRQWSQISSVQKPAAEHYEMPNWNSEGQVGVRSEADGGVSFKPAYPWIYHGWGNKVALNGADVRGVYVSVEFRLIKDDPAGVDDTAQAVYAFEAGADYYYDVSTSPCAYENCVVPAAGNGRVLKAQTYWRKATLLVPNFSYGASYDEFRSNPPPL
jgi:hypothetical protein